MQMIMNGECGVFNPVLLQCLKDIATNIPDKIYRGGKTLLRLI